MILKKVSSSLLFTALLIIPAGVFAEDTSINSLDRDVIGRSNMISENDAKIALQNYVKQMNYEHGEVILKEKLYDVDDSLLAYYFTIEDKAGYYIVTAVDTLNPIMEYSIDSPYSISFKEKGNKKAYYIGLSNIVFSKNATELEQKFKEDNFKDLDISKKEEEELKKMKTEKVNEKKELEESSNSQNKIQELTDEINDIVIKLKEYDEVQLELEKSELEPFKKQEERSPLWDELLTNNEYKESEYTIASEFN